MWVAEVEPLSSLSPANLAKTWASSVLPIKAQALLQLVLLYSTVSHSGPMGQLTLLEDFGAVPAEPLLCERLDSWLVPPVPSVLCVL